MHRENRSVGELAYQLWQARGCPDGTAEQDWLDAERQLRTASPTLGTAPPRESATPNPKSLAAGGQTSHPPEVSRKVSGRRSTRAPKKGDMSSTDQRK
jgi:hypothetical protein